MIANRIPEILNMHKDTVPWVRKSTIWTCENTVNMNAALFKKYIWIFEKLLDDSGKKYVRPEATEIVVQ